MEKSAIDKIARALTDEGKLIEAGWCGFEIGVISAGASATQRAEMRNAFFAGSLHLFTSIMSIMDDDKEATDADLSRLSMIHHELKEFGKELALKCTEVQGNA